MTISPINIMNLQQMESALYNGTGGFNMNVNCPSAWNGYMANSASLNPYSQYSIFGGYNPSFTGSSSQNYNPYFGGYTTQNDATRVAQDPYGNMQIPATQEYLDKTASEKANQAQIDKDLEILADEAMKANEASETFGGACFSGLTFAALENMQVVKHPFNSYKALKLANQMFDMRNPEMKAFWKAHPDVAQKAYSQAHAAFRRMEPKWKLWGNFFAKPLTGDALAQQKILLDEHKAAAELAAKTGNLEPLMRSTERLKAARGMDGYLVSGWNWVKNNTWNRAKKALGFEVTEAKNLTPYERIAKKSAQIEEALKASKTLTTLGKIGSEFKGWAIFEGVLEGVTKVIPTYFKGGVDSGNKQLLQSGAKVVASSAGWAIGRVAGGALGTKIGATIGSCICPGVGTAVGAIVGFAGGCIGSWLGQKLVKKLIPQDESTKLAKADMLKDDKSKGQLLQNAYAQVKAGKASSATSSALNRLLATA